MVANLTRKAQLILPHVTNKWQRAASIADNIPELSAQQVAAELAWRLEHKHVESRKIKDASSRYRSCKEFRLKGKLTVREEALAR